MNLFSFDGPDGETAAGLSNSLLLKLIFLLLSIIICSLLGLLLIQLLSQATGMTLTEIVPILNPESPLEERNFIRWSQLLNQLTSFVLPVLLMSWFFYRRDMWRSLSLYPPPHIVLILFAGIIMLTSFPLTQLAYWFNQQLPLPPWMSNMEDQANDTIKALLVMDSPAVFLFNLTVIALMPALGEELLFRGVIQQQIEKHFHRPVAAVWISAVIFSAFHLQFAGFFPRLLLGALLGYLLLWTRSLWVPMAAHFVFNGAQIVGHYMIGEELIATEQNKEISANWPAAILSVILLFGLIYLMRRFIRREQGPVESS
ncbi:MAG: type II CAAX endopeptidase family protein [Saprospiraceae bacterium]|nr:CPBP family intramembrane metalloprotease [Lewinella sp.]